MIYKIDMNECFRRNKIVTSQVWKTEDPCQLQKWKEKEKLGLIRGSKSLNHLQGRCQRRWPYLQWSVRYSRNRHRSSLRLYTHTCLTVQKSPRRNQSIHTCLWDEGIQPSVQYSARPTVWTKILNRALPSRECKNRSERAGTAYLCNIRWELKSLWALALLFDALFGCFIGFLRCSCHICFISSLRQKKVSFQELKIKND